MNACIDYGMKLKVFVPQSQKTYTFILDDLEVRLAIEGHVGRDGLSGAEILNPDNIMAIADRLLVRVINGKPVVIFSRRGRAERGKQGHKVGKVHWYRRARRGREVKDSEDLEKAVKKAPSTW